MPYFLIFWLLEALLMFNVQNEINQSMMRSHRTTIVEFIFSSIVQVHPQASEVPLYN